MTQHIIITQSGFFGRGATVKEALNNVIQAGAKRSHAGSITTATGLKEGETLGFCGSYISYPEQCVGHITTINLRTIGSIVTN